MATAVPRPRIDERALGAGTTVRFAMLLVLLLAASGSMMLPAIYGGLHSDSVLGYQSCELAAGVDPVRGGDAISAAGVLGQDVAFLACLAKYAPPPPWWEIVGWPALLSAAAGVLLLALPAWKARRGRVVPLALLDQDGELGDLLAGLAATAGLARVPRVVVDPAAASTGAVVFGRTRRPVVCLHGGLLASRRSDLERFRAVLLHELAHIANRDVSITYATVALWRTFLAVVFVPYLAWQGSLIHSQLRWWNWHDNGPSAVRNLLLPAVMVALVHLARADVLRSREVYADLAAVRWGADPHSWAVTVPDSGGRLRRALARLREPWSTHPHWHQRRDALTDPAALFGVQALPMFLTGAATTLIAFHLFYALAPYNLGSEGLEQLVALAPAALVTGIAGVALWRSVVYAVLTSGRVPTGIRAGLWLGAGSVAGALLTGYAFGPNWLPDRPYFLLLPVVAGGAFAWWVTQCASLWAASWRRRTLRPVLLLSLVASCLVLASWFTWWWVNGMVYVGGFSYGTAGIRRMIEQVFPGSAVAHPVMVSAVAVVLPILGDLIRPPLAPVSVAALWVLPLAAWSLGSAATGTPGWAGGAPAAPAGEPLPRLRRVLLPGLLGGVLAWVGVAGVQAYLHTSQRAAQGHDGPYVLSYLTWVFVALVAGTAVAAVTAVTASSRHRLLGTLIAAGTAAVLGLGGMFLLVSSDGCVRALNTLERSCAWRPAWKLMRWDLFPVMLTGTVVLGAITAALVAATASLLRRVRPRRAGRPRPHPPGARRGSRGVRRLCVSLLCVAALGIAVPDTVYRTRQTGPIASPAIAQRNTRQWADLTPVTVSAEVRAGQVYSWRRLGGGFLLSQAVADANWFTSLLRADTKANDISWPQLSKVRPTCEDLGRVAGWENGYYFRVPDPQAEIAWHAVATQAWQGSQDCVHALDQKDMPLFLTAVRELVAAGQSATTATTRIDKVLHEAGYQGNYLTPCPKCAQPPRPRP
ncbi:M48 family metalloprotease [Kitasatospora sp. McL0602]|uniref:M48 family metalloprotease n=1 Tax=Kitasatospora sp. McL0602 TaxID=3439530 RepID=UPI003F8BBE85